MAVSVTGWHTAQSEDAHDKDDWSLRIKGATD